MAKQAKKAVPKQSSTRKANTLESITDADALAILEVLAARNENLAQKHLSGANAPLDLLQPPHPPHG